MRRNEKVSGLGFDAGKVNAGFAIWLAFALFSIVAYAQGVSIFTLILPVYAGGSILIILLLFLFYWLKKEKRPFTRSVLAFFSGFSGGF